MQRAISFLHNGLVLRGMEHIPENEVDGKIPAVILFHGFTGTKLEPHRIFLKISRELEKMGFASFRFDFLGSGESDGNFEDMTVSKEILDASAILDFVNKDPRIDASRVYLVGLSLGGLIASVLAGDRPNNVNKLVLLAPAGNMYEIIKNEAEVMLENPDLQVIDHGGNLLGRDFFRDLKALDIFGRAKNYRGDVLLVHGTQDEVVPFEVSNWYQERSYNGRGSIHFIEGADHTFNKYEWEHELIQSICGFLKE